LPSRPTNRGDFKEYNNKIWGESESYREKYYKFYEEEPGNSIVPDYGPGSCSQSIELPCWIPNYKAFTERKRVLHTMRYQYRWTLDDMIWPPEEEGEVENGEVEVDSKI
jgi:hypothetical protein